MRLDNTALFEDWVTWLEERWGAPHTGRVQGHLEHTLTNTDIRTQSGWIWGAPMVLKTLCVDVGKGDPLKGFDESTLNTSFCGISM